MSLYKDIMWNLPGFSSKTVKDEEEEKRMRRIFHLFPKRKRSLRRPPPTKKKHSPPPPHVSSKLLPIKKRPVLYTTTPPKWIHRLKKDMNIVDDDPILIAGKPLDLNDVDPDQNRLSIPFQTLQRSDFLTSDERRILGDGRINNGGRIGVPAFLVDQRTKQWKVVLLKKWVRMCDSGKVILQSFLLSGEWSDVVEANGLREEDSISLWSFRLNGFLFFALDFAGDSVDFLE